MHYLLKALALSIALGTAEAVPMQKTEELIGRALASSEDGGAGGGVKSNDGSGLFPNIGFPFYEPGSSVTDHANIDIDQAALAYLVDAADFANAKAVYEMGGGSKPAAICTGVSPVLAKAVAASAEITFTNNYGQETTGKAGADFAAGGSAIDIYYKVSGKGAAEIMPSEICHEGKLPAGSQESAGCINTGRPFTIAGDATKYTAGACSNMGKRTLKSFSTKMVGKETTEPIFAMYNTYYGAGDYADKLVTGALLGINVPLNGKGMDFSKGDGATNAARGQVVKKGTAYLNAWMYAVHELEAAIGKCKSADATTAQAIHAWDEGVAFYVGTSATNMAYSLGQKRCTNFKTCGKNGDSITGIASSNIRAMNAFNDGNYFLVLGQCEAASAVKDKIVSLLSIPLVQGTLRYGYKESAGANPAPALGSAKQKAEGATFAAAILGQVNACSATGAATVYANMNMNTANTFKPDVGSVKKALESCYTSMGITCADIGSLVQSDGNPYPGMAACTSSTPSTKVAFPYYAAAAAPTVATHAACYTGHEGQGLTEAGCYCTEVKDCQANAGSAWPAPSAACPADTCTPSGRGGSLAGKACYAGQGGAGQSQPGVPPHACHCMSERMCRGSYTGANSKFGTWLGCDCGFLPAAVKAPTEYSTALAGYASSKKMKKKCWDAAGKKLQKSPKKQWAGTRAEAEKKCTAKKECVGIYAVAAATKDEWRYCAALPAQKNGKSHAAFKVSNTRVGQICDSMAM